MSNLVLAVPEPAHGIMALLYNSSSAVCCPDQRRSVVSCPQSRSCDLSLHALIHVLTLTFLKSRRKGKAIVEIITNMIFWRHFIFFKCSHKIALVIRFVSEVCQKSGLLLQLREPAVTWAFSSAGVVWSREAVCWP